MELLKEGKIESNFLEGMGCAGGCVGGPKGDYQKEKGGCNVEQYAREAKHLTPLDNVCD
jgi:iron only hydrogenase large subunit-like protein